MYITTPILFFVTYIWLICIDSDQSEIIERQFLRFFTARIFLFDFGFFQISIPVFAERERIKETKETNKSMVYINNKSNLVIFFIIAKK